MQRHHGIEKYMVYHSNQELINMSKYKTGHSFSSRQLFDNFYSEQLNKDLNNNKHNRDVANQVFLKFFTIMLDDIIDNNKVFKLPTKKEAYIEPEKIVGEDFKIARQQGFFKDIDIIKSNFQGIIMQLRFRRKYKWTYKRIIVDNKRKQRLINNLYLRKY